MIARWSVDIFHKNARPKSLIKIPAFSRNLLFTIIIMRREMSFRLTTRNEILDRRWKQGWEGNKKETLERIRWIRDFPWAGARLDRS